MNIKKIIGVSHLWLGLASGLVVFIIAITGCLYAFQEEIQNLTEPYRFVEAQNKPMLPPTQLQHLAEKALPGKEVHAVLYPGATNAARAIFYKDGEEYYYITYINQYTGEVQKVKNMNNGFFPFILDGHFYLWLPHDIGKPIVASATLVFFAMVLTGIVLWWPRNKAGRKQRFAIKWDARWRRKNYDLHNVLGFYASWVGIIFAITGLVWGFEWFNKVYYATISGGKTMVEYKEPESKVTAQQSAQMPAMDRIWLQYKDQVPASGYIEVHTPHSPTAAIAVNINPDLTTYWKTDYRYFDQYTLQELDVKHQWGRFENTTRSEKLMRMNYDIHTGAVWGLPGKILAFCASLIIASLPITGTLIWWGRKKKSKQQTKTNAVTSAYQPRVPQEQLV